jgi:hypothetical protein
MFISDEYEEEGDDDDMATGPPRARRLDLPELPLPVPTSGLLAKDRAVQRLRKIQRFCLLETRFPPEPEADAIEEDEDGPRPIIIERKEPTRKAARRRSTASAARRVRTILRRRRRREERAAQSGEDAAGEEGVRFLLVSGRF